MKWHKFDDGNTIETLGSEGGKILIDEENELGARITLENCKQFFAITCGIYGWFFHTKLISESEAFQNFEMMKSEIESILKIISTIEESDDEKFSNVSETISKFVDKFP